MSEIQPVEEQSPVSEFTADAVFMEVEAIRKITEALQGFDKKTCARMLDYAADRFADCVLFHKHINPTGVIRARDAR